MKKRSILVLVLITFSFNFGISSFQSGQDIFQKALAKERAEGNLEEAILLYQKVLDEAQDMALKAQAQLRIGLCYEKLGLKNVKLAQNAFRKVIDNYPSQSDEVRIAKEKLATFLKTQSREPKEMEELRLRKVWAPAAGSGGGAPSPDGRYISYVDWDTGDLAIYEIATGKEHRVTNNGSWDEPNEYAGMSRWSPDGKQIVYAWHNKNGFYDLRIIGIDGSKNRILFSDKEVIWTYVFDWSQDGEQILAYFDRKDGTNIIVEIVLVSTSDGSVSVLKTFDEDYPENLCFSPDGRFLVYDFPQKVGSPERDIFLLSTDGIREIPLVEHPSHDELLGWAPDGNNIIFASDRNGTFSLWNIKIAEGKSLGKPELVRSNMGSIEPLGFTREGSFYFGYLQKSNNIFTVELNPKTGKILALPKKIESRFEGYNQSPIYSPDGKYLAYISRRFPLTIYPDYTIAKMGGNVLSIRSLETGKERDIFPNLKDKFFHPRWSPDGLSVFVKVRDANDIYRIDTQTGNAALVLQDDKMGTSPFEISPDGKTIFYVRRDRENKTYQFLAQDLENGDQKELYRSEGDLHIKLSPDGQWFIIQENYLHVSDIIPNLSILPSTGGELQELWSFEDGIAIRFGAPSTWTLDGKNILFAMKSPKKDRDKWDLYRISIKGGDPEKLGLEMGGFIMNLSIHQNGRDIAFSTSENENKEFWVLENFLPLDPPPQKSENEFKIQKVWEYPPLGRGNLGRVSPDGQFLAVSGLDGNLGVFEFSTKNGYYITKEFFQDKRKISIEQTDQKTIKDLLKGLFPIWSPDGNQIAFINRKYSELCIIGADLHEPRVLYKTKDKQGIVPIDWSPNGKYIFAAIEEDHVSFQAGLISVEDGSMRVLKDYDSSPNSDPRKLGYFSPDGKFIAGDFDPGGDSKKRDISLLAVDGSSEITLIDHPDDDMTLGWSNDGKMVIFASDRSGTLDIWAAEVKNGKPQGEPSLIKRGFGFIKPLGFTKDNTFYYLLEDNLMDVFTADFDPKKEKIQFPPVKATQRFEGSNRFPAWSPDGQYFSYISFRTSGNAKNPLCIHSLETGDEREIIHEFRYIWGSRWSPDGRSILVVGSAEKDKEGFYLVDVKTGGITSVIQFEAGSVSEPAWASNGKQIFYTYKDPQNEYGQIIKFDLQSEEKREIYRGEFNLSYIEGQKSFFSHKLAISPDGKWLAFNKGWSPVLMIVPTAGGESREVFRMKERGEQISTIAWMPESQDIIFVSYQLPMRESDDLWRISASGENLQKLGVYQDRIHWMSAHPDGEKIVFGSSHRIKDVWVMENFLPKLKDLK